MTADAIAASASEGDGHARVAMRCPHADRELAVARADDPVRWEFNQELAAARPWSERLAARTD